MRTYSARKADVQARWLLVDAEDLILGRLAARIATILQGKHKPIYTPHIDTGDYVIVVNARKIRVTGRKLEQKTYSRYTGYPGGLRTRSLAEMLSRNPEKVIELAVRRMLPKTKLGRAMFKKLKVYAGPDHPHAAQKPVPADLSPTG